MEGSNILSSIDGIKQDKHRNTPFVIVVGGEVLFLFKLQGRLFFFFKVQTPGAIY